MLDLLSIFTKRKSKGICAIEIDADGFAFAYAEPTSKEAFEIKTCDFYPFTEKNELKDRLSGVVNKYGLQKVSCNLVLSPDEYRLFLINAPNVPADEYKTAARWQVKDIINYPLDDAGIDIFSPGMAEHTKKIFVVATQISLLQGTVNILKSCQLAPLATDIREFAIRNLLSKLIPNSEDAVGVLDLSAENCLFVSLYKNYVQFVRQIPLGIASLISNPTEIISEVRRSLTFCAAELKQAVPKSFWVLPSSNIDDTIIQIISKNLEAEVHSLDLNTFIKSKAALPINIQERCWPVIGGCFRELEG